MYKFFSRALAFLLLCGLLLNPMWAANPPTGQASAGRSGALLAPEVQVYQPAVRAAPPPQASMPVFRFPIVPGATTGGYFDHQSTWGLVTFYDGRYSSPGAGFTYSCGNPYMNDWVGCQDPVAGEPGCNNNRELWYDNHRGIDYEFSPNWHTGAFCDPGRFAGITMPIFSPARAQVLIAGYDPNRPGNGWHIRLKHDLNNNGNFNDDNFRSIYLHFTANSLAVYPGQIVEEGQYLGLGGSTGYSSSPHLHFEVQRSSDYFQTNYWSVDPYGWQGPGNDPWPYTNLRLFRNQVTYTDFVYLPAVLNIIQQCSVCAELLSNGGFEAGPTMWVQQGTQLIASVSDPNLRITPQQGTWLGWLGGISNTSDALYQNIQIPNNAGTAVVSYYLNVVTTDVGAVRDVLYVNLRDVNGGLIRQLDYADNTFSPGHNWVQRSLTINDLGNWQGQTLRLSFESTNSAADLTSFFIDSISFGVTGP